MSIRSITYGVSDAEPTFRLYLETENRASRSRAAATHSLRIVYRFQGREYFFETTRSQVILGRYRDGCPVDLDLHHDLAVSRPHARIWVEWGELWIEDLNSRHGTKVNDREIKGKGAVRLSGQETIRLGNTWLTKISLASHAAGGSVPGSTFRRRGWWQRFGSLLGWLGIPFLLAIVVVLWLPFSTREAIAQTESFRHLPLQGLLQKALLRAQTDSSRLFLQPGLWHGLELDVPNPSRICAALEISRQPASPMPVEARLTRRNGGGELVERQRVTLCGSTSSYPLLATRLEPGKYTIELEAGSAAPGTGVPAQLVVTAWH